MHIGNTTAMLAAWLDSKAHGRRMTLRIEDIDTPRVLPDADRWIMDDLHWLGMDWDGEPVYQSRRLDLYERALRALTDLTLADGTPLIYPCFCSRADIRAASAPQEGDGFQIYPGTCRRLAAERPDLVRERLARGERHSLRIALPETTRVTFSDRVFGACSYDASREIGDCVIRRSDGLFGYQFVVTVDDLTGGIDSIVRGRDLLRSTALQAWIRDRLIHAGLARTDDGGQAEDRSRTGDGAAAGSAAEPSAIEPSPAHPAYAHIPLVDNAAGRRLAKRERSLDMGALRLRGVAAEQVVGYCAWLLRLTPTPEPCRAQDLLTDFDWEPLHASHEDRAIDPDDARTPRWLAEAVG